MKFLNILFIPLLLTNSFAHSSEFLLKFKQKAEQHPQIVKIAKIAALGTAVIYAFSLLKKTDEIAATMQPSSPAQTKTATEPISDSVAAASPLPTNPFDPESVEPIGSPAGSMVIKQEQQGDSPLQAQTQSLMTSHEVPIAVRQAMLQQGTRRVAKKKKEKKALSKPVQEADFEKTLAEMVKQISEERNDIARQRLATSVAHDEIINKITPEASIEACTQCQQTIEAMLKLGADKEFLAGWFKHQRKKIRLDVPGTETWANHADKRRAHKQQCQSLDQINTILGVPINPEFWDRTDTPTQWGLAAAAKTVSPKSIDPHNLDQAKAFLSRIQRAKPEEAKS